MASTSFHVPRTHLIMALCLPVAVALGFFLAEPTDYSNMAPVLMVLGLLSVLLLMKWHHLFLIASWNAFIVPMFIRGHLPLWMLMSAASLLVAVLNRAVDPDSRFIRIPSLTAPLVFFAFVVLATMYMRGGLGLRMLGSSQYGGKWYLYLLLAVAGYFAMTSSRIPANRAVLYVTLFCVSGCTALISDLLYFAPNFLKYLYAVFPPTTGSASLSGGLEEEAIHFGGMPMTAAGVLGFVLARYGLRGTFDLSKPWRLGLIVLALAFTLLSGFRSALIGLAVCAACMFVIEGLWRTRAMVVVLASLVVCAAVIVPFSARLPLSVQRTLSFLPIPVDTGVRDDARASSQWRLEMWERTIALVPQYLIKGKGYALDPADLYFAQESMRRGLAPASEASFLSGDYHSGPLTVIVPLGMFGALAFLWFLVATLRLLYYNFRYGDPSLKTANSFLLALFLTKTIMFIFVFGSLCVDFSAFAGIAGLSVSLNGGLARRPVEEPVPEQFEGELTLA